MYFNSKRQFKNTIYWKKTTKTATFKKAKFQKHKMLKYDHPYITVR